jgi:hypothetical protein
MSHFHHFHVMLSFLPIITIAYHQGDELHDENVCHVFIIWSGWGTSSPQRSKSNFFSLDPSLQKRRDEKNIFSTHYSTFDNEKSIYLWRRWHFKIEFIRETKSYGAKSCDKQMCDMILIKRFEGLRKLFTWQRMKEILLFVESNAVAMEIDVFHSFWRVFVEFFVETSRVWD